MQERDRLLREQKQYTAWSAYSICTVLLNRKTRLVPKWRNRCAEVLKIPRGGTQTPTRGHWTERGINEIKSL